MSAKKECIGVPCDGLNCVRARYLRLMTENGGDSKILGKSLEHLIKFQEKIIGEGKCQQPEELREAIKKLKDYS